MPYLKINTNLRVESNIQNQLCLQASALIARILAKPESYVMIEINNDLCMSFAGNQKPLAYLELKSLGLPEDKTSLLSESLCQFINNELGIPEDRIYIEFASGQRHLWGWNNKTFQN